jgi:PST family polysaccharide transporter
MVGQGGVFALRLGAVVVLARLLAPADFGLVAMVTAITGFLAMVKDAGLSMATVQRVRISHEQVSALFWINVAVGLGLVVATTALGPLIARLYGEPRLAWITAALAAGFFFGGLTVQHQALLRRQMRFASLAGIHAGSVLVGSAAGISAAAFGAGSWALVVMHVTTAATAAGGVWLACGWRPGWPARWRGVRLLVAFGGNLTGGNLLAYACRSLDKVVIGAVCGAGPLGVYSRAYEMLLAPVRRINAPLGSVMLPALSRLQDQPARFRRTYRRAVSTVVAVGVPGVVFAFVCADRLVLVLLGPQWSGAAPIFRALAPAGLIATFNFAAGWVFIPLGRTDRQFRCVLGGTVVMVAAVLVGVRWGALGVAVAYSVGTCARRLPQMIYAYHGTPVKLQDLGEALWRPTLASVLAGGATAAGQAAIWPSGPVWAELIVYGLMFGACYAAAWLLLPGGRGFLAELLRLSRAVRPRVGVKGSLEC